MKVRIEVLIVGVALASFLVYVAIAIGYLHGRTKGFESCAEFTKRSLKDVDMLLESCATFRRDRAAPLQRPLQTVAKREEESGATR